MFEEVRIRERKSMKHGKTYEYRFETAPVGGERKWLSKGGFLSEEEARQAGIQAWKRYCLCGLSERPSDISYADFLDAASSPARSSITSRWRRSTGGNV